MDSRYFEALGALKETVRVSRFHSNPMYIVDVLKGWSLDSSQGMLRRSEMVLISHMLYVKSALCSDPHNAPALSHTTRTDEADNRPCYMTS